MPNPTAHADDMKSLAVIEPNNTPALWWVNPWGYALNLKRALDAVHLLSEATEEAYQSAKASLAVMTEDRDNYIAKYQQATAGRTLLVSRDKQIDGLFADIEREKQKVEAITLMCNERDRKIGALEIDVDSLSRQLRAAKRKLAKAEKAAGIEPAKKKGVRRA